MKNQTEPTPDKALMPVLFIGHGSPMNALEENQYSQGWRDVAKTLPKPKAILCVSAHWETRGTQVTGMDKPRTIHDFGGFPQALYNVQYAAPGNPSLANTVKRLIQRVAVDLDAAWGLDHGCWSVLKRMYPAADIPVIQLSLDHFKPAVEQYAMAKELAALRKEGVLLVGSGNMVHNLGLVELRGDDRDDFNQPFGFDWAIDANGLFKRLIDEGRHTELANYHELGEAVRLAIPTPEHFLPMLYVLALQHEDETVAYFNDQAVAGSLTMTSFVIDNESNQESRAKQMTMRSAR